MKTSQLLLKNRTILHTLSTICDIIDAPKSLIELTGIFSILFFKSTDRPYGDKFIHMIKAVFTNIQSKIKISGFLSEPFSLMQGVCQGRPLSMMLYIIAAEVFCQSHS